MEREHGECGFYRTVGFNFTKGKGGWMQPGMSGRRLGLVKGFVRAEVFEMGVGTNPERTVASLWRAREREGGWQ